jgi:hypothetical protein
MRLACGFDMQEVLGDANVHHTPFSNMQRNLPEKRLSKMRDIIRVQKVEKVQSFTSANVILSTMPRHFEKYYSVTGPFTRGPSGCYTI